MSEKILIVDDSKFTRNLLRISLEKLGFWVDEAGSPAEALKLVRQKRPDLVISDLKMPDLMDGLGFLRVLALEVADLPVMIYTSDAEAPKLVGEVGIQRLAFLNKPAAPDRLRELIAQLIART